MAYPQLTDKPGALATAAAIRAGRLSVAQAVDAAIVRIEQLDGAIDALAVPDFERAYAVAKALDAAGPQAHQPLFGVPMTVKESFDIAGLPTTYGQIEFKDNIAARDAVVVQRLKRAGVVILGKTNVPPDLSDLQSANPVYGRTNNPHDPDRVPGGSSGGSAAAVASGMVPCDYGSDIGSSIRNPAHFCGVWGHKSSFALVSRRGHTHPRAGGLDMHDSPLSVVGPLARSAADLAALIEATTDRPLQRAPKPIAQCRMLALADHPLSEVDASVREPFEAALAALAGAGAAIDCSSDLLPDLAADHDDYIRLLNVAMAGGRAAPGREPMALADYYKLLDRQARAEYAWEALFETYDFVLAPPLPFLAYRHDPTPMAERRITINGQDRPFADALFWAGIATWPNLPATVLPIGSGTYEDAVLPCGMQVIGPRWSDLDCIFAAEAIGNILHG
jgi:amidase